MMSAWAADATPDHEHRYEPNDLPWMENRP